MAPSGPHSRRGHPGRARPARQAHAPGRAIAGGFALLLGGFVLSGGLAGCDTNAKVDEDGPRAPLACATAPVFGNGQLCDDSAEGRAVCGDGALCAAGWLCFDSPRLAFCTCTTDADCERHATYINQARVLKKHAPISASCEAGRCAGL